MSALFFGPTLVTAGMTILTQGTGGVSCFAIQLAAAADATVIANSLFEARQAARRYAPNKLLLEEYKYSIRRRQGKLGRFLLHV